jgi:hypothetical protein
MTAAPVPEVASIIGPAWSGSESSTFPGRFPLSVERHVLNTVDRLLPGVTTVTLNARYYALHALIASEADARRMDLASAQSLLRRAEVVMGAVSARHWHQDAGCHSALSRPHAYDLISPQVRDGHVNVAALAAPRVYAQPTWGFWPAYRSSEMVLGIISRANDIAPGERLDHSKVRDGLAALLDLAQLDEIAVDLLDKNAHLCICKSAESADGAWLADLLAAPSAESPTTRAGLRRQTLKIIARAVQLSEVTRVADDVPNFLSYNESAAHDPVLREMELAAEWRGLVLRNLSVTAWRVLWAWIVNGIDGLISRSQLADQLADNLPAATVSEFRAELPDTRTPEGHPAPVEISDDMLFRGEAEYRLAVLMLGATRSQELDGAELHGFQGHDPYDIDEELAPAWLADRLVEWHDIPLKDYARWLTESMLNRSQRLALRKARFDPRKGQIRIPTRVFLRDDFVFRDSTETGGQASLRLGQAASILAGVGLLGHAEGRWTGGPRGSLLA